MHSLQIVPVSRREEVAPRHVAEWDKATSFLRAFLTDGVLGAPL